MLDARNLRRFLLSNELTAPSGQWAHVSLKCWYLRSLRNGRNGLPTLLTAHAGSALTVTVSDRQSFPASNVFARVCQVRAERGCGVCLMCNNPHQSRAKRGDFLLGSIRLIMPLHVIGLGQ